MKADDSPVTEADMAAHKTLLATLARPRFPGDPDYLRRRRGIWWTWLRTPSLFLVDPLDGTRSYVRGDGQLTVNIGLVERGTRATFSVIYVPVQRRCCITAGRWFQWTHSAGADGERAGGGFMCVRRTGGYGRHAQPRCAAVRHHRHC